MKRTFVTSKGTTLKFVNTDDDDETTTDNDENDDKISLDKLHITTSTITSLKSEKLFDKVTEEIQENEENSENEINRKAEKGFTENSKCVSKEVESPETNTILFKQEDSYSPGKISKI